MATDLIPLSHIPTTRARNIERQARSEFSDHDAALAAARYKIVAAPGYHSRPYFDPPVHGWTVTREAAQAIADEVTVLTHDHSRHQMARFEET